MSLPVELITRILADTWASLTSTEEHIEIFTTCSLVSREWFDIIKEVNSTHSWIPLAYNSGQLYIIKSLSSISNPTLCRTLTFRLDFVILPWYLARGYGCQPSVDANRGLESLLRKLFCGPNPPRHATHIYVDYLDGSWVHIPNFWVPPQITRLTILYYFRSWMVGRSDGEVLRSCGCLRSVVDRQVEHLSILGATPEQTRGLITPLSEWRCLSFLTIDSDAPDIDIPFTSRISVLRIREDFRYEAVEPDFLRRVMFGNDHNQMLWFPKSSDFARGYIPIFEQVIPVGSVGYIDPMTAKFIVLFNAVDPRSSTDARLDSIPSLLNGGATKLVINPNYSSSQWDEDQTHSEFLDDIIVGELEPEKHYISLGRASCKELVGTHFETWALDHKEKILDIFGDEHPYIQKRLDLVTSVIDSSQYAWFAHLGFSSRFRSPGPFFWHPFFHLRIAHPPVPGTPWGEFKMPKYYDPPNLLSWSHVSTVGQSPMTVQIRCQSVNPTWIWP